jgi:16S rRNA (guanine966-N2)-methyltransferase
VKVSLFDWLGSLLARPGVLPPIAVLDVFCGGGSLGIESLSRGASFCTFIDSDRAAQLALRDNLASLKIGAESVRIISARVEIAMIPPPPGGHFGLAFLDPPYSQTPDVSPQSTMGRLLARLQSDVALAGDAVIAWRHESRQSLPALVAGRPLLECRVWGSLAISLFRAGDKE